MKETGLNITVDSMYCYNCGQEITLTEKISRQQTCPECGVYLHCCLNCRFFGEVAYHKCRESEAEWVSDKRSANFCDYFQPGEKKINSDRGRVDEARRRLDELFGD